MHLADCMAEQEALPRSKGRVIDFYKFVALSGRSCVRCKRAALLFVNSLTRTADCKPRSPGDLLLTARAALR